MEDRFVTHLAIGMQKDSEFKEIFDYQLLKMKQAGMLLQEAHHWLRYCAYDDSVSIKNGCFDLYGKKDMHKSFLYNNS